MAEGLTSQLAGALTRVPGLRVASVAASTPDSAGPAAAVQPAPQPPAAPAADATTLLVRGTVQREGEQMRVVLRLVDPARDSTLWSETFDRAASEAFALQDDAARALVAALALRGGS